MIAKARKTRLCSLGVAIFFLFLAFAGGARAAKSDEELANDSNNPVAPLISVPLQSNFEWGAGRRSEGFRYLLNVQPVVPIPLTSDWNLVLRTIVPIVHQSDTLGTSEQSGLGDVVQSWFLSPSRRVAGLTLGVGPAFELPTTTERGLGAEKFGIGPTLVALKQESGWTLGVLSNHIHSIGGTRSTADVEATFLQPFASYTTKTYTTLGVSTESTYDWKATKWTVPLIATASQLLKLGDQAFVLQAGPKYYAEAPRGTPDWGIRFTLSLLFPE